MRTLVVCLAGSLLLGACSKAPPTGAANAPVRQSASAPAAAAPAAATAAASGPAVSGTYTGNGKAATLTQVTAHADDPFDGKPVTALVFSEKDQGGDAKAATDALFGNFGDAIVIKLQPDGSVISADVVHSNLKTPGGSISIEGVFSVKDYSAGGGQISGHLTSNGETDVFDQKVNVDLTFHVKAP